MHSVYGAVEGFGGGVLLRQGRAGIGVEGRSLKILCLGTREFIQKYPERAEKLLGKLCNFYKPEIHYLESEVSGRGDRDGEYM